MRVALRRVAAAALSPCLVAACSLGPRYRQPPADIPAAFVASAAGAQAAWPAPDWWQGFGSPELDALIAQSRSANEDLAAAAARIVQADAQVRISGAPLLPSLIAQGTQDYTRQGSGSSHSSFSSVGSSLLGGRSGGSRYYNDFRTYSGQFQISYDVDFWGRNRALYRSAQFAALATRFDQQTVALDIVTSVASTYFTLLAYQDRTRFAERNLRDAEQILGAYRARVAVGTATALDVSQQEALVAGERAALPNLRNQGEQERIALGILLGVPPERLLVRGGSLDVLHIPGVTPGLPSEMLARRPDVAYAEAEVHSQNGNIQAARAAFFPTIQLTASGGVQSAVLSAITGPGTLIAALGTSVTQSIFDNGLRRGQYRQAEGRFQELAANYRKSVLQAFTDVEQALVALRYTTEQEKLEREAVRVAEQSATIARAQLLAGTIDIITELNTQATLFNDLDLLAQIRLARFQASVNLFKALGGGWSGEV